MINGSIYSMLYKKYLNLNFLLWLFFYIAIFSYALNISFSYIDADLPWHLRIGQQIIDERAAPTVDYYNHTLLGKSWVDHEWLFNAFFYFLYNNFGYISLNVFFALLLTLIFIVLKFFTQTFFIKKYLNKDIQEKMPNTSSSQAMFFIMSLTAYGLIALTPLTGVRMQIAGNLLFLILLVLLELFNKNKQKKYLLVLPFLFIFWANIHGSFLIGLVILWAWLGLKTIEATISKLKLFNIFEFNLLNKGNIIFAYFVVIVSTLSTLINPYGLKLYSFLSGYTNSSYLSTIAEWHPFYYLPILYNQLIILAIFLAIFVLSIYSFNNKNKIIEGLIKYVPRLNFWFISLCVLFFILSLKSKRHFPLFLISSFALMVQFLYFEFGVETKNFFSKTNAFILKIMLILIFSGFSFYFLLSAQITNNPFSYKQASVLPYEIVTFLKNNPELKSKKILNAYSWGGYFLWMMPETKLFIDGRMPQVEYRNHSLLEEYKEFFEEEKAEKKLLDHQIELVIFQKDMPINLSSVELNFLGLNEEEINNSPNHLQDFLMSNVSWDKIYEDKLGEVYLRK